MLVYIGAQKKELSTRSEVAVLEADSCRPHRVYCGAFQGSKALVPIYILISRGHIGKF